MHLSKLEKQNLLAKIRTFNDPILSKGCAIVDLKENLDWIKELEQVVLVTSNGVGIAAPQLGYDKRVFVTALPQEDGSRKIQYFINPEILTFYPKKSIDKEGCLSYPGFYKNVERCIEVNVRYFTDTLEKKTEIFRDFHARVIQHEFDHLNGKCELKSEWLNKIGRI